MNDPTFTTDKVIQPCCASIERRIYGSLVIVRFIGVQEICIWKLEASKPVVARFVTEV